MAHRPSTDSGQTNAGETPALQEVCTYQTDTVSSNLAHVLRLAGVC